MKDHAFIGIEEASTRRFNFLEIRHYLKADFSYHVKPDSRVADHSIRFALSDPDDHSFFVKPSHEHDLQCQRCSNIVQTFRYFHTNLAPKIYIITEKWTICYQHYY